MKKIRKIFSALLIVSILVASFPLSALADNNGVVNIPDKNLLKALISDGADTNKDGQLSVDELANFTSGGTNILSLWGSNVGKITSIEGLQYATKIKELVMLGCQYPALEPAVLQGMTSLNELQIEKNDITTIPANAFAGTNIRFFYLEDNKISTISANAFSGLNDVWTLDLGNNPITSFSDDAFDNCIFNEIVGNISVNNCGLSTLKQFDKLTNLDSLDASNNSISDIAPIANIKIHSLKLSNNNITDITPLLNWPTTFYGIDVSYNYLDDVTPSSTQTNVINTIQNSDSALGITYYPQKVIFDAKDTNGAAISSGGISGTDVKINLSNYDTLGSATVGGTSVSLSASNTFTKEGSYTIIAYNHNVAFKYLFTIDKSAPVVTAKKSNVTKLSNGAYSNNATYVTYSDLTAVTTTVRCNGESSLWPSSGIFTSNGSYSITVTDATGKATTVTFVIDRTKPKISLKKKKSGYQITVSDTNLSSKSIKLNGKFISWGSGSISKRGTYVITAVDKAGNQSNARVKI